MSTIKKNWVYAVFAFSIIFFITTKLLREKEQVRLELKIIRNAWGWGYEIYANDTLFIHQEIIPAADGKNGFISKNEALIIGHLAMEKIKKKQIPTISLHELDSCKITR